MKGKYARDDIVMSPKKGLVNIRLPKKVVANAFDKLYKRGDVIRISHQDESGDTSVMFLKGARKKVEKVVRKLQEEFLAEKAKSKGKKGDKKKK